MTLAGILVVALSGAILARPLTPLLGRAAGLVLSLVPLALFAALLARLPEIGAGTVVAESHRWVPSLGVAFALRLDGFSLLFALLVTGIGALVTIYAGAYFADAPAAKRGRFLALILIFMTAMLGTVLADDLIVLFVFWEATSLASFMLIGFDAERPQARRAALQSLLVTAGGGLAMLAGILLIGAVLGTFSLSQLAARADELAASPLCLPVMALMLAGAFTKSAQVPFHFWLPNAMEAPTPASAYLHSATMVKLGVYLLARLDTVFASVPAFGATLVLVGSATMLVAVFEALKATGYKAVLAQSTVASLGIIVMLIGLDGEMAVVATIGFILAHALYKAALFFCAGTAIHATGTAGLRRLGGLARVLPFTAAAAVLASLSMAGLPPFVGFIAKEFLFEAQLSSGWNALLPAVAVLVNAAMVGLAGLVALKPFFAAPRRPVPIRHGETAGLLAGPLLLAACGLALGLFPEPALRALVEPAVAALRGSPVDISVGLWHGFTPVLALSGVAVAAGAGIFAAWPRIHVMLRRRRSLAHVFGDGGYRRVLDMVLAAARVSTRILQNGDQHRYVATTVCATLLVVAAGFATEGVRLRLPEAQGAFDLPVAVVLLLAVAGAFAAIFMRSLIASVVAVGMAGFASAIVFMVNGAPDLALTQFSVETLFVVIAAAVLLRLPAQRSHMRSPGERGADAALAAGFGLVVFVAVAAMWTEPLDTRLSDYFARTSLIEAQGRNVVNVILVDYRAIDTAGEIAVVAFATLAVWGLLRPRPDRGPDGTLGRRSPEKARRGAMSSLILSTMAPGFFWLMLGVSVFILLRGHNAPGGGFVGGLIAACGFAVLAFADGVGAARRALRVEPVAMMGAGLMAALLSGVPGLIATGSFLTHLWTETGGLKLGTTLLFDLGVYLVVLGGMLCLILSLYGARR